MISAYFSYLRFLSRVSSKARVHTRGCLPTHSFRYLLLNSVVSDRCGRPHDGIVFICFAVWIGFAFAQKNVSYVTCLRSLACLWIRGAPVDPGINCRVIFAGMEQKSNDT